MNPVVVTMGDPAGIGVEITLQAWADPAGSKSFVLIADPDHVAHVAAACGLDIPVKIINSVNEVSADSLSILPLELAAPVVPGHPDLANAKATIDAITRGVELVKSGAASALVTNPIHKDTLYQSGFIFPGHTEYLGHLCGNAKPVMMLIGGGLRVALATIHIPLADVSKKLDADTIVATAQATARDLTRLFNISAPRLAIAALNPHAGESGSLGREEIEVIAPAVATLQALGIDAKGPYPADTLFHEQARKHHDAVICMYHDQALIPLKTLDFDGGVNVTLGLPIIRTSPDHGTAFDIAGKAIASPRSLMKALNLAIELSHDRG